LSDQNSAKPLRIPVVSVSEVTYPFSNLPTLGVHPLFIDGAQKEALQGKLEEGLTVLLIPYGTDSERPTIEVGSYGVLAQAKKIRQVRDDLVMVYAEAESRARILALEGIGPCPEVVAKKIEEVAQTDTREVQLLEDRLVALIESAKQTNQYVSNQAQMESLLKRKGSLPAMLALLHYYLARPLETSAEKFIRFPSVVEQAQFLLERFEKLIETTRAENRINLSVVGAKTTLTHNPGDQIVENSVGLTRIEDVLPGDPSGGEQIPVYQIVGQFGMPEYVPVSESEKRFRPLMSRSDAERFRRILTEPSEPTLVSYDRDQFERVLRERDVERKVKMLNALIRTRDIVDFRAEGLFKLGGPLLCELAFILQVDLDLLYGEVYQNYQTTDYSSLAEKVEGVPAALKDDFRSMLQAGWRFLGASNLNDRIVVTDGSKEDLLELSVAPGVWYLFGWPAMFDGENFTEFWVLHEGAFSATDANVSRDAVDEEIFTVGELYLVSLPKTFDRLVSSGDYAEPSSPSRAAENSGFAIEEMDSGSTQVTFQTGSTHRNLFGAKKQNWFHLIVEDGEDEDY
jgi:hypothetical protein